MKNSPLLSINQYKTKRTSNKVSWLSASIFAVCASLQVQANNLTDTNSTIQNAHPFKIIEHLSGPIKTQNQANLSKSKTQEMTLTFRAFSEIFTLNLHENKALIANLDFESRSSDITLYAGSIDGIKNSWARITRTNGEYSGAVYDGIELYLIDSSAKALSSQSRDPKSKTNSSGTIIYRASDISSTATCATDADDTEEFSYDELVSELSHTRMRGNSYSDDIAIAKATKRLKINIVADKEFVNENQNARAEILKKMNVVDGIFSEQIGVQLKIKNIKPLKNNGSLTSTDSGSLLNSFRSFVGKDNPGLTHLFSGKELDGNIVGIAYLGGVCKRNGVGLSQATGGGIRAALTIAHEIGHNFGSPHDSQSGSSCSSTDGTFLMSPVANGSKQFSQCSRTQIKRTLEGRSCLY